MSTPPRPSLLQSANQLADVVRLVGVGTTIAMVSELPLFDDGTPQSTAMPTNPSLVTFGCVQTRLALLKAVWGTGRPSIRG